MHTGVREEDKNARMVVYVIRNLVNHKCYVGQTRNALGARWKAHISAANNPSTPAHYTLLFHALRKYGMDAFEVSILEESASLAALDAAEVWWIAVLGTYPPDAGLGYNLNVGGGLGREVCAAACAKISAALTGKPRAPFTDAHRARIAASRIGTKATPEARANMSKARRGWHHSAASIAKIRAANVGKKLTPEHLAKLSVSHLGHKNTPEQNAAIGAAHRGRKGKPLTDEQKAAISAKLKGRKHTPEQNAAKSARQTGRKYSAEFCAAVSAGKRGTTRPPITAEARANASVGQRKRREREREAQNKLTPPPKAC